MMRIPQIAILAVVVPAAVAWAQPQPEQRFDVVVVGGTPAGIIAAVAAAREGSSVALLEASRHVGGVVSGGLTASDVGRFSTVGGLSREFFDRVWGHYAETYGADSEEAKRCNGGRWFEPHVAEKVFLDMLSGEQGITLFLRHRFYTPVMQGKRIASIRVEDLDAREIVSFAADMFVDATYEGDLMACAGVPYRMGREGAWEYGESLAGVRPGEPGTPGDTDLKLQAYNYRLCLTDRPDILVPIPRPPDYDPADYKTLAAFLAATPNARFEWNVVSMVPFPGVRRKPDANNGAAWQSTDFVGANYDYPGATWPDRDDIAEAHKRYILGLLYFVQNDPSVSPEMRAIARKYGLAADEFTDNDNWPYQMYVREARRMVGQYVFREQDAREDRFKEDSIGVGSYTIDCHGVVRVPRPDGTWRNTGGLGTRVRPYEIPYGVIIPREVENLFVPVCCSATHVGYCTLRMEPVYMILGHASGVAAHMARTAGVPVQKVNVKALQERLASQAQKLRVNRVPVANFRIETPLPLKVGQPVRFADASSDDNGVQRWFWDFDGNGKVDSSKPDPTFTYRLGGAYQLRLMVYDGEDWSEPLVRELVVEGEPKAAPPILVDDDEARFTGGWIHSTSTPGFVGQGYRHDGNHDKGAKTARYVLPVKTPGTYDISISYTPNPNRATNVPVVIHFRGGEKTVTVNQRRPPRWGRFVYLGSFPFNPDEEAWVEILTNGTDGFVIADAVRATQCAP